jgi:hypothetical protein
MVVPQAQQADWRPALQAGTAPRTVTAAVPVIASGTEAIRVARKVVVSIAEGTIERDRAGAVPARPFFEAARSGVLPSNHGQI